MNMMYSCLLPFLASGSLLCNVPTCFPTSDSTIISCSPDCFNRLCDFMASASAFDFCNEVCSVTGCDLRKTGNSVCDPECNSDLCAYDYGDCSFCARGCNADMLGNGVCDDACNVVSCSFDMKDCEMCSVECLLSQLGDGVCDTRCNNANCDFDAGDCPVTEGCLPEMQGDGVCNAECLLPEYNWDSGDCNCAPNCYFFMLANHQCDQECNSPECFFDEYFCVSRKQYECAPGCFMQFEDDGVCTPQCNVLECGYDINCFCASSCYPWITAVGCLNQCMALNCEYNNYGQPDGCNDEPWFRVSMYYQIVVRSVDLIWDPQACLQSGCYIDAYNALIVAGKCMLSCNTPQCAYAVGLCTVSLDERCRVGYGNNYGECFECKVPYVQYFGFCIEACPHGYNLHPRFSQMCILDLLKTNSETTPDKLYVFYDLSRPIVVQENVYRTLSDALAAAWMKYTEILLLGETMVFDPNYIWSVNNPDYLPRTQLPELISDGRWKYLTIRSLLCAEEQVEHCADKPITIYLKNLHTATLRKRYLTLENVVLTTSRYFQHEDIKYCPYLWPVGSYHINDRGQFVYGLQWSNAQCTNFTDMTLFIVQTDATLDLRNVKIQDVTLQLKAIIELEGGTLVMTNVSFINVQPSTDIGGAVILQSTSCDVIEYCSRIVYRGGSVSFMNNGYEFRRDLRLNPFISAQVLNTLEITGVTVNFTAVSDVVSSHGLILLSNFLSVTISDCVFSNNFFVGSLLSISSAVILPTDKKDSQSRLINFLKPHITINSSLFSQTFSRRSLIQITISRDLLNLVIADCRFEQIALAEGSVVEVRYEGVVSDKESTGMSLRGLWISPRWINMTGITFTQVTSFDTLISITNCVNVLLSGLNLTRNGERSELSCEKAMRFYITTPTIYASVFPSYGSDLSCSSLLTLDKVLNISISNTTISENKCSDGGTGVIMSKATGTNTVTNVFAYGNSAAKTSGVVLTADENVRVEVWNLTAIRNEHSDRGVIYMGSGTTLRIACSQFEGNIGLSGAAINADGTTTLSIVDSVFIGNTVSLGNGGAISVISNATSAPEFTILNAAFSGNRATSGGAIYLSFPLYGDSLKMTITSTRFYNNSAETSGSSLHTTALLQFTPDSSVFNCSFECESSAGGVLCLQHIAGTLTVSQATFERNQGSLSAAFNIQTSAQGRTVMNMVEFRASQRGPAIAKPNYRIYSEFQTHQCSFFGSSAPLVALENGLWEDFSSVITSSQVTAVEASLNSHCVLSGTSFLGNHSPMSGGAIHLSSESVLYCHNCEFTNNGAAVSGGAVFAEQNSEVRLERSRFEGNYAEESGSAIYLLSVSGNDSAISECEFEENHGGDNSVISCFSSSFQLLSSLIASTKSDFTAGISIRLSSVIVSNCSFSTQNTNLGMFLSVLTSSSVVVSVSTFTGGKSSMTGAVSLISSNLTIVSSGFRNIGGRVFSVNRLSFLALHAVTVTKTSGNVIYISESSLNLFNCYMSQYESGAIYGSGVFSMTISNTLFSDGAGQRGSAVSCYNCRNVAITASQVMRQAADQGALFFDSDSVAGTVTLTNTLVTDNRANSGAGLHLTNYNLTVTQNTFRNNTADEGGAVFLDCHSPFQCGFSFLNTTFENNAARQAGGAVRWKSVKPQLLNAVYINNAAPYGPEVASFPVRLNVLLPRRMSELTIEGVPPGQDSGIVVTARLVDHYDQVVSSDNSSYAELRSADLATATVSGVSKVVAISGVYNFQSFQVYSQPGKAVSLVVTSPAVSPSPDSSIQMIMRDCEKGETKTELSCLVCGQGTYNFNESQPCQNCPKNAECLGRAVVLPVPGYWKPEQNSTLIIECARKLSCLGGRRDSQIDLLGFCAEGYKSNLCQSCAPEYFRSGKNLCQQCPDFTANAIQSVFIALAMLVAVVILVWSTMRSALKLKSVSSIYLKILLNYVQVLYLVSEIDLDWPDDAWSFFQFHRSAGGVSYSVFSPDCLLGDTEDTSKVFYRKMIFLAVLPIAILIGVGLFWAGVALWTRKVAYMRNQLLATLVIVFFFIHPTLVQAFFSMFSCREILPGEQWLTLDMATKCWNHEHLKYLGVVGIPALLLWVVGIPVLILALLVRNRTRLGDLALRKPFGFLITGYKPQHFYWEFVVLFRKIAIICISSFFNDTAVTQALGVLTILFVYTCWFFQADPYTRGEMNRLEMIAVAAADFTLYAGLFYLIGNLSPGGKWFFFFVIIIPNIAFYAIWILEMLKLTGLLSDSSSTAIQNAQYIQEFISAIPSSRLAIMLQFPFDDLPSIYCQLSLRSLPQSVPDHYGTVLHYRSRMLRGKLKHTHVAPMNNSDVGLLEEQRRKLRKL